MTEKIMGYTISSPYGIIVLPEGVHEISRMTYIDGNARAIDHLTPVKIDHP
jgi:hypothetical protein